MANALIEHEQILTTLPKAKELRRFVERLVTLSRKGDLNAFRHLLSKIRQPDSVRKLLGVLAERYKHRPGGYTRVLKAGFRPSDSAPLAVIEFVDRDPQAKGAVDRLRYEEKETEKVPA
jgi:large subunit ribosomal protein L17